MYCDQHILSQAARMFLTLLHGNKLLSGEQTEEQEQRGNFFLSY